MRIAFITNALSLNGGVGKYVLSLALAFSKKNHEVLVVHEDKTAVRETFPFKTCFVPLFSDYAPESASKNQEVIESLLQFAPDIVHVQASMNYSLENRIRCLFPAIKSLHVYDFCPSGTKYHYALEKACIHKPGFMCLPRMVLKRCTHDKNPATLWMFYRRAKESHRNDIQYPKMIVASDYIKKQALQAGYTESQIEVIPYFAAIPKEEPILKPDSGDKIFMATGRMVIEKGFDKLLDAMAPLRKFSGWKIIFDGHGAELENLKKKAQKLGLQGLAEFPGWLAPQEHHALYQKAFAVIVPSIWPEPFGLVGIEAMSYAKPVIAFQSGGIADWIENGKTGYAVPTGDISMLSEKILYLLQNPETAQTMGRAGFNRAVELYREDTHLVRLLKLYEFLIENFEAKKS